jgi:prepilin-type processing-associated H-X9-DG protein
MTLDVTGGLREDWEYVWAHQPEDPEARESVNAWIWDDSGGFGLPRVGVEALADQWDTHDVQVNIAFADGRVFNVFVNGPVHNPLGADGKPRILGAGPLSFEIVEPYRHLRLKLDGQAITTTAEAQMAGWMPWSTEGEHVAVKAQIDIRPVLPPWENGSTSEEARRILSTQEEGYLIGYPWRFEQLCSASGDITIGTETHRIRGGANRIRRQGVRRLAPLRGHVWQAAAFPSGFGFGFQIYPPRTDGKPTYNEGYIIDDGKVVPARVVKAPFLNRLQPEGEDVSLVLAAGGKTIEIDGHTTMSTFMVMPPEVGGGLQLQQALARYSYNGETVIGMIERSTAQDQVSS